MSDPSQKIWRVSFPRPGKINRVYPPLLNGHVPPKTWIQFCDRVDRMWIPSTNWSPPFFLICCGAAGWQNSPTFYQDFENVINVYEDMNRQHPDIRIHYNRGQPFLIGITLTEPPNEESAEESTLLAELSELEAAKPFLSEQEYLEKRYEILHSPDKSLATSLSGLEAARPFLSEEEYFEKREEILHRSCHPPIDESFWISNPSTLASEVYNDTGGELVTYDAAAAVCSSDNRDAGGGFISADVGGGFDDPNAGGFNNQFVGGFNNPYSGGFNNGYGGGGYMMNAYDSGGYQGY